MSSPTHPQPDHPQPGQPQDPHLAPAGGFNLVEFATRRRVTIAMMTLTLVLFGLIALGSLKVNLLPDLSYPTLTVRTDYEGAAPAEIETLISQPAEEALGVVKGLRKLKSVSRTGQSDMVLEFAWGTDMDQASLDVRDKMESLSRPLDAKAPVLLRFNPSTQPIMRLALSPKQGATGAEEIRQLMELRRFADDDLKRKLEPVDGVAAVKVGGGLEDEVQVDVDQRKLAQFGLSLESVINRLQQENVNVSGGGLEEATQRYGAVQAFGASLHATWRNTAQTFNLIEKMITGQASTNNLSGVIGIAQVANQSASMGLPWFLQFLALVSLSLAILNLLPIPLLDGGHLLYYLVELVKGSPVSEQVMIVGQYIGLALLFTLMGLAFYNDIHRMLLS